MAPMRDTDSFTISRCGRSDRGIGASRACDWACGDYRSTGQQNFQFGECSVIVVVFPLKCFAPRKSWERGGSAHPRR